MIVFVAGTRPELIKIGPIFAALQTMGEKPLFLFTGQHQELVVGTPIENDLRYGESLELPSDGNVTRWTTHAIQRIAERLRELEPELVVVQGDTMSAIAGAIASVEVGVALAHVEAGVRSHCLEEPWPEESHRVEIARHATWHYAPTTTAFKNLVAEGVPKERIRVLGNPVVSAIYRYTKAHSHEHKDPTVFVTLHRREIQKADTAWALFAGVQDAAILYPGLTFVWPIHPGFAKFVKPQDLRTTTANLKIVGPMPHEAFVEGLARSIGVITDSGGVVEEAVTLGVPSIIMRKHNDRPEAVEVGSACVLEPTRENIVHGAKLLVNDAFARVPHNVYGPADSATMIARHLAAVTSPVEVGM